MYRVYIVDDEFYAREGIKDIVCSAGCYELVGESGNSSEALREICRLRPDIVLSDINMPVMDGIELVQAASAQASETKFILITGHDRFEYAKRAFKFDIVDFILKPVDEDELLVSMQRATAQIHKARRADSRALLDFIRGERSDIDETAFAAWDSLQLVLFQFDNPNKISGSEAFVKAEGLMRSALMQESGVDYLLNVHINRLVCILRGNQAHDIVLSELIAAVKEQCGIVLTAALTPPAPPAALPKRYPLAKQILLDRFYQGHGKVLTAVSAPLCQMDAQKLDELTERVRIAVKARDHSGMTQRADMLFQLFYETKCPKSMIFGHTAGLYAFSCDLLAQQSIPAQELKQFQAQLQAAPLSLHQRVVFSMLSQTITLLRLHASESDDDAVRRAIIILSQRYCDDISLDSLAKEVYLNPSYLSRKLKELLGESFVKHLTRLRMERAMNLLAQGEEPEAVSAAVGYPNYRYFSEVFKLHTGYSPRKYRKQLK